MGEMTSRQFKLHSCCTWNGVQLHKPFLPQVAVLGLCELIMHPSAPKPFEHIADKLIPYFITLLKNLRVAYQLRREEENEESEEEEGEEAGKNKHLISQLVNGQSWGP